MEERQGERERGEMGGAREGDRVSFGYQELLPIRF